MSLILTIINQAKPGQEISKAFEQEGTIGRSLKNSWVLIDPNRFISSQHARIHLENNNYYITDLSTNGLYINKSSQPLGKGNKAILKQGDVITIGEYEISVSVQTSLQNPSPYASPFGITPPPSSGAGEPSFPPFAPQAPKVEPPPSTPLSAEIDSDAPVDPLALFNKPASIPDAPFSSSPFEPQPSSSSSLEDLLRPSSENAPSSSTSAGSAPNHAPPLQQHFQPPQTIPDNWDFLGGDQQPSEPTPSEKIPPLDFEKSSEPAPAFTPGTIGQEKIPPLDFEKAAEAPRPVQTDAKPSQAAVSESAVLQSLLAGMHMESLQLSADEVTDFSHIVGEVTHAAIKGMLTALRARSSIKSEFRMSMTTMQAKENNPLKFSATVDDALVNMFHRSSKSYLPPAQAMIEGFNDLEAHMIAVMAGMQVALNAVLRRFDPANLEKDFAQRQGGIATMLPGGKKAKHWDAYLEHYKDIIASAEDDFQTFFGDEFTRAYEEQVRKLKQARGK